MNPNYEKYTKIKKGKSDYRVSVESGVPRSVISDWKTGKHTPNLSNIHKIAAYLKVSIEELI